MTFNLKTELTTPGDLVNLKGLLKSVNLPTEDLPPSLQNFLVVKDDDQIVASVGWELYGRYALLRSLATDPSYRNAGVANKLYEGIIALAKDAGVEEVYLITNTAEQYFAKKGYAIVSRDNVPEEIKNTAQFAGVCPSSAIVMKKGV